VLSRSDRILITGGAGLVGSHVTDLLVRQYNPEIVVLDNFTAGTRENLRWALAHGRVEVVEGDVCDAALVHTVMNGVDVVFHHAAIRVPQCLEDPRLGVEVMAVGSFTVLEAAALSRVRKIIAASSASVYGTPDEIPVTEAHHPYNNRSIHGATNTYMEGLLRSFNEMYGLNYVVLRCANVYGPRMDVHSSYRGLLVRWMDRLAQQQPCVVFGDGRCSVDLIYVEDVARANVMAANSVCTDEIFNIGSGAEICLDDLAACLGRSMGSTLACDHRPSREAFAAPHRLATAKAERLLGFKPEVSLEEGLARLVAWWERHRALEAAIA
jgi:UDP-glucose 4-epimerase